MSIFEGSSPIAAACDPKKLLDLIANGEANALDKITRCYGTRLLEVGRKQCSSNDSAQDAVQDALLAAATHLNDFRGDGSLEGWLSRMVTNACRRMQRGRKADASLHEEFGDDQAAPSLDPEDLASNQGLGEQLITALLTLSPEDRAIVLLGEVNGWKGPEIAESLGLTAGQVRTRLSRSRRKLRDQLTDLWRDWDPKETNRIES